MSPMSDASLSAGEILLRLTASATLAAGALLHGAGSAALTTLALGTAGRVLVAGASAPAWSDSGLSYASGVLAIAGSAPGTPSAGQVLLGGGAGKFGGGVSCTTLTASGIDTSGSGPAVLSASAVNTAGKTTGLWFGTAAGGSLVGVAAEVVTAGTYPTSVGKGRLWAQNGAGTTTVLEWFADGHIAVAGKITTVSAVPGSFDTSSVANLEAAIRTWLAAQFT